MDIKIHPGKLHGTLTPPPSKSFLHRAIISASLAKGKSVIENILIGEDIQSTIEAFRSLGVKIEYYDNQLLVESSGQLNFKENHPIQCHESGSTMRFLMPVLTNKKGVEFYGESSLLERPVDLYEQIYANQNNEFVRFEDHIYLQGDLQPGNYIIKDNTSSQYVSGLLFALPRLSEDSTIRIPNDFQSRQYIHMTIDVLSTFGITIKEISKNQWLIPGSQNFQSAKIIIEADYSQAAFFMVGAAVNGDVIFENMNQESLQPDKKIIDILIDAGATVTKTKNTIKINASDIQISNIDLSQTIDLGPILFLLATKSNTHTTVKNYERLIYKESNRLENMLTILDRMNVKYIQHDKDIVIDAIDVFTYDDIDAFNDHRVAMAIAIFATLANTPTIIRNMHVMNKSYPTFINDLKQLNIQIQYLS